MGMSFGGTWVYKWRKKDERKKKRTWTHKPAKTVQICSLALSKTQGVQGPEPNSPKEKKLGQSLKLSQLDQHFAKPNTYLLLGSRMAMNSNLGDITWRAPSPQWNQSAEALGIPWPSLWMKHAAAVNVRP